MRREGGFRLWPPNEMGSQSEIQLDILPNLFLAAFSFAAFSLTGGSKSHRSGPGNMHVDGAAAFDVLSGPILILGDPPQAGPEQVAW